MNSTRSLWHNIGITVLAITVLGGTGYVLAAPTQAPPISGGINVPLHVGPEPQTKEGPLTVNGTLSVEGQICVQGECADSVGGSTSTEVVAIPATTLNCTWGNSGANDNVQYINGNSIPLYGFGGAPNLSNFLVAVNGNNQYQNYENTRNLYAEYNDREACNVDFTLRGSVTLGTPAAVIGTQLFCRHTGYANNYYSNPVVTNAFIDPSTNEYVVQGFCPMTVTRTEQQSGWNNDDYESFAEGNIEGEITVLVDL